MRYWDPAWQRLILVYLHRILQQGFDGVYLDRVDVFAFWADSLGMAEAARRMIRWIQILAESARTVHPGFWIVPQNGEDVLAYDTAGILRKIVSGKDLAVLRRLRVPRPGGMIKHGRSVNVRELFRRRYGAFWRLTLANGIAQIGDRMGHMALIALLGRTHPGSFGVFGGLGVMLALPIILLSPFVGSITDRTPRKELLLAADLLRVGILLGFAVLSREGAGLWGVYGLAFFWVGLTLLFNVAKGAYLPDLVPGSMLLPANSLNAVVVRLTTLVGAVGGGFLTDRIGPARSFLANSLTYLVSFFLIWTLPRDRMRRPSGAGPPALPLREARAFLARGGVAYAGAAGFFAASGLALSLLVPYVQQHLAGGTAGVGVAGGLLALGLGAGILGMGFLPETWLPQTVRFSLFLLSGAFGALPLAKNLTVLYAGSLTVGVGMAPLLVGVDTLLQHRFPREERGRAFALKEGMGGVLVILSSGLSGVLADRIGFAPVVTAAGMLFLLLALTPEQVERGKG